MLQSYIASFASQVHLVSDTCSQTQSKITNQDFFIGRQKTFITVLLMPNRIPAFICVKRWDTYEGFPWKSGQTDILILHFAEKRLQ